MPVKMTKNHFLTLKVLLLVMHTPRLLLQLTSLTLKRNNLLPLI